MLKTRRYAYVLQILNNIINTQQSFTITLCRDGEAAQMIQQVNWYYLQHRFRKAGIALGTLTNFPP